MDTVEEGGELDAIAEGVDYSVYPSPATAPPTFSHSGLTPPSISSQSWISTDQAGQ